MEELLTLKQHLEDGRYPEALHLVMEMEAMSKEDKINKIYSFVEILLLHLIKQMAEKRSTRSWELSMRNAARQIARINTRRSSGGVYVDLTEMREIIADSFQPALERAALEAFEGRYEDRELGSMIDRAQLEQQALDMIIMHQGGGNQV
jgi:hypothetical protein